MAWTSTVGRSSGASRAAAVQLVLLVAVLVGSSAPGAQAILPLPQPELVKVQFDNILPFSNDLNHTIVAPTTPPGLQDIHTFVPAGESRNFSITPAQSLSPVYIFRILGNPPLGGGIYNSTSDPVSRSFSLAGIRVVLVGVCGDDLNNYGLLVELYLMPFLPIFDVEVSSECIPRAN